MRAKEPVRIITVSRDYGSGGGEIAQLLGRALSWRVIDHALLQEVARRIEAPEAELEPLDEHVAGIVERIAGVFARGAPEAPVMTALPDPDMVARIERAVLRDALGDLPFIVVGHGGQCVFAERADALHVRIIAPLGLRIQNVARRKGLSLALAARETERHDSERKRYIHHHFGCDANDPGLYTLQLNTGFLTTDEAATIVLQVVDWRESQALLQREPAPEGQPFT